MPTSGASSEPMPTCPTCLKSYPGGVGTCVEDGTALVPDETFAHVEKDVAAGTVIGEYRIEAKLGEGGFGAVYRAVHPLIGKMAAVKILSRQYSSNPQMVSRFVAEARAVNQIRHRNIIDIFSFGQLPDGRQYYIMELLEGESFDAYLAKKKRLSLGEAMPILRGIARALDASHAKDILHRDLKPENVYLVFDEEGRVEPKLLDFGLVKLMADTSTHKTKTGTPMGTPYYMSPEQCRGLEVDTRTDVYSFGALVFEVLTGEVPFDGDSTMDILLQHISAPPPRPSQRCPEVPGALDAPLARLLAKERSARPARVGEALDLLARAVDIESGGTLTSGGWPNPAREDEARVAATANTIADDGRGHGLSVELLSSVGAGRAPARVQTYLGAATDVGTPPSARSRLLVVTGALALLLLVGGGSFILAARGDKPAPIDRAATAPASAPGGASEAPPTPLPPAVETEIDVTIVGAPEGASVSADGVELGPAPGPFKLKSGAAVELSVAAKSYTTKVLTITPTENVLIPVSMEKTAPAAVTTRRRPSNGKGGSRIHSDLEGFDAKK